MRTTQQEKNLEKILNKAKKEIKLTPREITYILKQTDEEQIKKICETAGELRERYFGNKIYLYGFIYFTTYCRNNCTFCFYRKDNKEAIRYRKTREEIIESAISLKETGIHLLDLTMGEDPKYYSNNFKEFEKLLQIIEEIKQKTKLPVMISPGVVSPKILKELKKLGVEWYACYQETHNKELYKKIRQNQDYEERMNRKRTAHEMGFLIEEGLLAGIGEKEEDTAHSITEMRKLNAEQIRVMSFIPQKGTPMSNRQTPPRRKEMLTIAAMRIAFPDRLIPASLDVDGLNGLKERLQAGANVITSLIPPQTGLKGVSQNTLDIEEGNRAVQGIQPVLQEQKLIPASVQDYKNYIKTRIAINKNTQIREAGM